MKLKQNKIISLAIGCNERNVWFSLVLVLSQLCHCHTDADSHTKTMLMSLKQS